MKRFDLKKEFRELVGEISLRDVFVFLAFPLIISLLMLLPPNLRYLLVLKIHNPSWWQFLTNAFVHKNLDHLYCNLLFYFIFGLALLIFADKLKKKKELFLLLLFTFVFLPVIISIFMVLVYPEFIPMIKTSQGSSGIVSAIGGVLIVFWIGYILRRRETNIIRLIHTLIMLAFVITLSAILFLANLIQGNSLMDPFAHLIGLLYGITMGFLVLKRN